MKTSITTASTLGSGPPRWLWLGGGAARMKSGLGRVSSLGEHDQVLEVLVVGAHEGGRVRGEPLVLAAGDHEILDVTLAIGAAQLAFGFALRLHHIELVADVLRFHR